MKKKVFVTVLCLTLLISLLPITARAANHISLVDLSVATPVQGAEPGKPVLNTNGVTLYAYEWYHNGDKLPYGATFEGGKTYTLRVRVSTLDTFMQSVSVKVNSRPANVLSVDNNSTGLLFEIDFYVTPLGYTLSFDPGYGSGTMSPMTGQTSYILPSCTFTPPSGKEFGYWLNEETSSEYQPGENIILSKDSTVRAVWKNGSGKTKIYNVEATSNIASIAVLYGALKTPDITVTVGAPARILDDSGNLQWQKKVNGTWETQYNGRFTAGEWRIVTQVRIDNNDATQYELGIPTTLKVDGAQWTMENSGVPSVHYNYSMIAVHSPSIIIQDNPNIQPPVDITQVNIKISGYQLGANADDITASCDREGVIVAAMQIFTAKDLDNDGIPDDVKPAVRFESGVAYLASFSLKAKDGYSLSSLGMSGVTCNGTAALGSYNSQDDLYYGTCGLAPLDGCKVSFNAGGGIGTMPAVTVEKGNYTLPQNAFNAPQGKRFKAWSVGGSEKAPGSVITLSGDITVTALWEDIPEDHVCKPESVAKVEPTCTKDGKNAHYRCEGCGKFFEDGDGKVEITDFSAWGNLEKLGHADKNQDNKCDTCGMEMNLITDPSTPAPPSTDPGAPGDPDDPADATDPTTPAKGGSKKKPRDKNWIWIVAGVLCAAAAAVIVVIVIRKKKEK